MYILYIYSMYCILYMCCTGADYFSDMSLASISNRINTLFNCNIGRLVRVEALVTGHNYDVITLLDLFVLAGGPCPAAAYLAAVANQLCDFVGENPFSRNLLRWWWLRYNRDALFWLTAGFRWRQGRCCWFRRCWSGYNFISIWMTSVQGSRMNAAVLVKQNWWFAPTTTVMTNHGDVSFSTANSWLSGGGAGLVRTGFGINRFGKRDVVGGYLLF